MRNLLSLLNVKTITHIMNFNTNEKQHSAPAQAVSEVTFSEFNVGIFTTDGKITILSKESTWEFGGSERTAWVEGIHLSW